MKKQNNFISMGIVSLFLIFTVFCMVILCLLTFQTSRQDLASARESFQRTASYYEACTAVTDLTHELNDLLLKEEKENTTKDSFYNSIQELSLPEGIVYNSSLRQFSIHCPFSETQELSAEYDSVYPADNGSALSLQSWNCRIIGEWTPDTHQNVYLEGENP